MNEKVCHVCSRVKSGKLLYGHCYLGIFETCSKIERGILGLLCFWFERVNDFIYTQRSQSIDGATKKNEHQAGIKRCTNAQGGSYF